MEKFDGIIFDLDGTLWDTIDICVKSLSEVKNKYSDILMIYLPKMSKMQWDYPLMKL